MKVYVFGNKDTAEDNLAFKVTKKVEGKVESVEFITVKPNEDLPFVKDIPVIILDTISGINEITVFTEDDLDKIISSPRNSVHDFDLGFQLKYLKKLGKLGKVKIIGLPQTGKLDYLRIQSILRKLVAQDIQGS